MENKWKYNAGKHEVYEYDHPNAIRREIPVSGTAAIEWKNGEDVTGKFKEQKQGLYEMNHKAKEWREVTDTIYSMLHVACRRIVAIPIIKQEQPQKVNNIEAAEKIYEKHTGSNMELQYLPTPKQNVIDAMKEYAALSNPQSQPILQDNVMEDEVYNKKYIDGLTRNYGTGAPNKYQYTGKKCVAGCKNFTGYETYHHKDCPFYPESFSKKYDEQQSRITSLDTANLELKAEIVLLDQAAGASAELMVRVMELEEERAELKERITSLSTANAFHKKAAEDALAEQGRLIKEVESDTVDFAHKIGIAILKHSFEVIETSFRKSVVEVGKIVMEFNKEGIDIVVHPEF